MFVRGWQRSVTTEPTATSRRLSANRAISAHPRELTSTE
jgi:hypothetical protein